MRIPSQRRPRNTGFDITPMIDVVFNLVIFFLIASQFARTEATEPVTLPTASQAAEPDDNPHRLIVTVLKDGQLSVRQRPVSLEQVREMIREGAGEDPAAFTVQLRADQGAPYGAVEPIMEACAAMGVTKVGFRVTDR